MSFVTTTVERKIPVHIYYSEYKSVSVDLDVLPKVGDTINISFSTYQTTLFTVTSVVHDVFVRDEGNFSSITINVKENEL